MDMVIFESGMSEQEQIAVLMEVESERTYNLCILSNLVMADRQLVSAHQDQIIQYYKANNIKYGSIEPPHNLHITFGYFTGSEIMRTNFMARLKELNFAITLPYVDTSVDKGYLFVEFGITSEYKKIWDKLLKTAIKFTKKNDDKYPHMTILKDVEIPPSEAIILNPGFDKLRFEGLMITARPMD